MAAKVLTAEAAKEAKIELIENGRGTQAVHDAVVAMRAARRSGSANTKTKADVNLSGAKPWRQKGTGRARAGYKSSPIWRGGGVVFGPKPRDYTKKVSKTVTAPRFSEGAERADQGRRCSAPSTLSRSRNRRRKRSSACSKSTPTRGRCSHFRLVRREHLPRRAQREAGAARDRGRREHRAIARLRQDHGDRQGAGTAGRKDNANERALRY